MSNQNSTNQESDKPSIGGQLLSFFVPLAGLVMYLNMRKDSPKKANRYGQLALAATVLGIILQLLAEA